MKRVPQFGWLAIVGLYFLAFCPGASGQTTWYVRSDGGTATQCTGKTYAAYPGSGSAQPCAYNHPLWLVTQIPAPGAVGTSGGSVRFAGGDVVLIRNTDTFEIGRDESTGAAAAAGCNRDPTDCSFPSFQAGTSSAHTIFAGTADGVTACTGAQRPKLTAEADSDSGNFIYSMFELNPLDQNSAATNYIDYKCLELQGWTTNSLSTSYPRYGFQNAKGQGDSTHPPANHISFINIYMHGFATSRYKGSFKTLRRPT